MFLEFDSTEARSAFIRRMEEARPDLRGLLEPAKTQERIVTVSGGEAAQRRDIRELAGGRAQVFDDIEFEPLDERG